MVKDNKMDSSSSHQSENPKRLKTLASKVEFSEGNILLHQFVLDNSEPNDSISGIYINAVLLTMSDAPADVVNAWNDDGYSPLHLAVFKNNLLMVTKLLSCLRNIDVNARCRWIDGGTALHIATVLGHSSIIEELLSKGANIDIKNERHETALCYAVRLGYLDVMKLLVNKGANVNPIIVRRTPLCHAVRTGNLEAVGFLICSGADVNFIGKWPPLFYAGESGSLAIVELLVSNGADVNIKPYDDESPLHYAVRSASLKIVECLVRNGADVNAEDRGGKTPLHHAVRWRKSENVAFLLDQGADVNAKDHRDETPLHYAVKEKNSVIDRFLKYSKVWERHDAVRQGNLEIVKLLTDQGSDLRAIDEGGRSPLHGTVYEEDFKIKKFLSDQGEGPHADRGWYPNYDAEYRGQAKVIRKLLDMGADVNAKNEDGETPLDVARNQPRIGALNYVR